MCVLDFSAVDSGIGVVGCGFQGSGSWGSGLRAVGFGVQGLRGVDFGLMAFPTYGVGPVLEEANGSDCPVALKC